MNGLTVIADAMVRAKIIDPGEAISSAEAEQNRGRLNDMLDAWSVKRLAVYVRTEDTHTLTAGTGSYTIGSGATIDTVRPIKIEQAYLRNTTTNQDFPLQVIIQAEYNAAPIKNQTARPEYLYYHPAVATGTIYFEYLPDLAYALHIFSWKPFTSFADLSTEYNFPPGYSAAIKANLAVKLGNDYSKAISQEMVFEATDTLSDIKGVNAETPKLTCALAPGVRSRGGRNIKAF